MKRILATLMLTCVLCVSALAGEIPTCNPAPLSATGDVPTASSESMASSSESSEIESSVLTDVLLALISLIVR